MDSKARALKPCPLGKVIFGTGVQEVAHLDVIISGVLGSYLCMGQAGIGANTPKYFLFCTEDISHHVFQEPGATCMAAITAEVLLQRPAVMGVPWVRVNGTARHFNPLKGKREGAR